MTKLSIVIPIYNSIKNLQRCLDSVLELPFTEYECIMVNDGSTDSSETLCKTYAEADRRFLYIQKEHGGLALAKNSGLGHSRGKYVLFLNPNDYLLKEAATLLSEVIEQGNVDFTAFSYKCQNEQGETEMFRYPMKGEKSSDFQQVIRTAFSTDIFAGYTGLLFDYEIIRRNKIKFQTDNPVYEDMLFISEYLRLCQSGQMINRDLLEHQQVVKDRLFCSANQSLSCLEHMYHVQKKRLAEWNEESIDDFHEFCFEKVQELFIEQSTEYEGAELRERYLEMLHHDFIQELLSVIDEKKLSKLRLRIMYILMRKKHIVLLSWFLGSRSKK